MALRPMELDAPPFQELGSSLSDENSTDENPFALLGPLGSQSPNSSPFAAAGAHAWQPQFNVGLGPGFASPLAALPNGTRPPKRPRHATVCAAHASNAKEAKANEASEWATKLPMLMLCLEKCPMHSFDKYLRASAEPSSEPPPSRRPSLRRAAAVPPSSRRRAAASSAVPPPVACVSARGCPS